MLEQVITPLITRFVTCMSKNCIVVQDYCRLSLVLQGCQEILGKYVEHPWIIHRSELPIHPCQRLSVAGNSGHPWIIHGCLASYSPLSENPWIPNLTSQDALLPTTPHTTPCQSIRGFSGNSRHPWIIDGLASYPPPTPHPSQELTNIMLR